MTPIQLNLTPGNSYLLTIPQSRAKIQVNLSLTDSGLLTALAVVSFGKSGKKPIVVDLPIEPLLAMEETNGETSA